MDSILAWLGVDTALLGNPTVVAGKIAFVGVVVALCGNALLAWADRWAKRHHDRKVMRSSLSAELGFLLNELVGRSQMMRQSTAGFNVPVRISTQVYDNMLDKIGLLSVSQAGKVIHA